jgi:hypothetical protein
MVPVFPEMALRALRTKVPVLESRSLRMVVSVSSAAPEVIAPSSTTDNVRLLSRPAMEGGIARPIGWEGLGMREGRAVL